MNQEASLATESSNAYTKLKENVVTWRCRPLSSRNRHIVRSNDKYTEIYDGDLLN